MTFAPWLAGALFYLAVFNLVFSAIAFALLVWSGLSVCRLIEVAPESGEWPTISLIAPARNEERHRLNGPFGR